MSVTVPSQPAETAVPKEERCRSRGEVRPYADSETVFSSRKMFHDPRLAASAVVAEPPSGLGILLYDHRRSAPLRES